MSSCKTEAVPAATAGLSDDTCVLCYAKCDSSKATGKLDFTGTSEPQIGHQRVCEECTDGSIEEDEDGADTRCAAQDLADKVAHRFQLRAHHKMTYDASSRGKCDLCEEGPRFMCVFDLSDVLMDVFVVCDICVEDNGDGDHCTIADAVQEKQEAEDRRRRRAEKRRLRASR
jgi:hypothetical protein